MAPTVSHSYRSAERPLDATGLATVGVTQMTCTGATAQLASREDPGELTFARLSRRPMPGGTPSESWQASRGPARGLA